MTVSFCWTALSAKLDSFYFKHQPAFFQALAMAATQLDPEAVTQPGDPDAFAAASGSDEFLVRGDQYLSDQVVALGSQHMCRRCATPAEEAIQKGKDWFVCKKCNATYNVLRRNLEWPPPDFSAMSEEDQIDFWRQCKESASEAPARLKYGSLKATLIKSITQTKTHRTTVAETSQGQPLATWKLQGWDISHIEQFGNKVWCPAAGWLYEVPLTSKTRSVSIEETEAKLCQSEQRMKQSKSVDPKDRLLEAASSEDEIEAPAPKKQKASKAVGKSSVDKEEAKAMRKQIQEDRKHNQKVSAKATKTVTYFAKVGADLKVAKDLAAKSRDKLPPLVATDIVEVADKVAKWQAEANAVLKNAANAASKDLRLPDLEWDDKQLTLLNGEAKTSLRSFNAVVRALKLS